MKTRQPNDIAPQTYRLLTPWRHDTSIESVTVWVAVAVSVWVWVAVSVSVEVAVMVERYVLVCVYVRSSVMVWMTVDSTVFVLSMTWVDTDVET